MEMAKSLGNSSYTPDNWASGVDAPVLFACELRRVCSRHRGICARGQLRQQHPSKEGGKEKQHRLQRRRERQHHPKKAASHLPWGWRCSLPFLGWCCFLPSSLPGWWRFRPLSLWVVLLFPLRHHETGLGLELFLEAAFLQKKFRVLQWIFSNPCTAILHYLRGLERYKKREADSKCDRLGPNEIKKAEFPWSSTRVFKK